MDEPGPGPSGITLAQAQGLAPLIPPDLALSVRRALLAVVGISALIAGVAASSAAVQGEADPGVVSEGPGGSVLSVSPTGFAFRDGIRAGQHVVFVQSAIGEGGWQLETSDGNRTYASRAEPVEAALRDSLPVAILALAAGGLTVIFLGSRRSWALPAGAIALVAASVPLSLLGEPALSTSVMAGSALVPAGWLASRVAGRPALRVALWVLLLGFLAFWATARLGGDPAMHDLEPIRGALALLGLAGLIVVRFRAARRTGDPMHLTRPSLFDLAAVAVVGAIGLALVYVFAVSAAVAALIAFVLVITLPLLRRRFGRPVERFLLADVREHAAAEALEEERARVARQIHDDPLQELTGIIRRLEGKPDTEQESDDLRAVAGRLRGLAAELRPPVLDDLGLAAALEYIAEETTTAERPIEARVASESGFDPSERPPSEVEAAAFRIAREAVANAISHARAAHIWIDATIAPDHVELAVTDDGTGLDDAKVKVARREKHLGLATMRRRAQAIDAEFTIEDRAPGTTVRLAWRR